MPQPQLDGACGLRDEHVVQAAAEQTLRRAARGFARPHRLARGTARSFAPRSTSRPWPRPRRTARRRARPPSPAPASSGGAGRPPARPATPRGAALGMHGRASEGGRTGRGVLTLSTRRSLARPSAEPSRKLYWWQRGTSLSSCASTCSELEGKMAAFFSLAAMRAHVHQQTTACKAYLWPHLS